VSKALSPGFRMWSDAKLWKVLEDASAAQLAALQELSDRGHSVTDLLTVSRKIAGLLRRAKQSPEDFAREAIQGECTVLARPRNL